jgi:hypothetical protein
MGRRLVLNGTLIAAYVEAEDANATNHPDLRATFEGKIKG